jgi:hypothetical protein
LLVDLHVSPSGRAPEALAQAVAAAGLDGAVITEADLDRWDTYADAFEALDLVPYLGIELPLDHGTLVFVPRDLDDPALEDSWAPPGGGTWTLDGAAQRLAGLDGAIIASHPYCRDLPSVLGDAVFDLKSVTAVITRVGQGKVAWDRQADEAADRRGAARLGSSSGLPAALGRAATILPEEADLQETLVDALEKGMCLPVELEDPAKPRDRRVVEAASRRDDDDRGGRRDSRGRNDRGGDRGGPRGREDRGGPRGPRSGGDDRRGPRPQGGGNGRRGR